MTVTTSNDDAASQPAAQKSHPVFTRAGVMEGMRQTAALGILVIPFGMAFGVAAAQAGMDSSLALLMSLVVMAGGAQFAALDMWVAPLPVVPILLATLAINSRHILYGAALHSWVKGLPARYVYPSGFMMADLNWALAMQARQRGYNDVGLLLGSGIVLWTVWFGSTYIGLIAGSGIGDPRRFGIDAVMPCVFAATLAGMWRGPGDIVPWLAAAAGALGGLYLLPTGWHVIAGALAGGIVGVLRHAD